MNLKSAASRENPTFRALYLMAILFVVDGHSSALGSLFDLGGLMRYYSFHLMLFAFGAGYFLSDDAAAHPGRTLARRAKRLLAPLYAWNLVYGVGAALLRRFGGFAIGQPLSAYTLLLAPLTDGEHFVWNLGSWFLFPLFLSQALYLLLRSVSRRLGDREPLAFLPCLLAGCAAVEFIRRGGSAPVWLLRPLILLPGVAGGALYRRCLEKHDTLPTLPYLLGLLMLRVLLIARCGNLAYLLSSCSYFDCGALGVYLGGAAAIAICLRVARLIAPLTEKSRVLAFASRHTFDIMMHHYMGFFAVNSIFLVLNFLRIGAADFSVQAFRTQGGYLYAPGGETAWNIVYVVAGMAAGCAVGWICARLKAVVRR